MTPSVCELYRQLTACGLMSAEEVNSLRASLSPAELDAEISWKFLEDLVGEDRITAYQARLLYEGRPQGISLGRYTILEQLGQGGMGVVYKALHRRMRRLVAVKVLPASLTSTPQAIERFQREVCAAARLSHPHIVSAYDADEADGLHFLVMEYIPGQDLARLVHDQGPLAVKDAVDVVLQAARGLDHAHSRGIIHRDIKPQNIKVTPAGRAVLVDFGIAKVSRDDSLTDHEVTHAKLVPALLA